MNSTSPELSKVVDEALRLQSDTKYPQAIIVSGRSGSGKSHAAMKLLRHLNQDSDAFKYLSAAITVLRSLGSAQTTSNRESSRIGHFIEAQIAEGELYRTKINCYFLDQVRTKKSYFFFGLKPSLNTPKVRFLYSFIYCRTQTGLQYSMI